jgi:hypothetical protein
VANRIPLGQGVVNQILTVRPYPLQANLDQSIEEICNGGGAVARFHWSSSRMRTCTLAGPDAMILGWSFVFFAARLFRRVSCPSCVTFGLLPPESPFESCFAIFRVPVSRRGSVLG